MSSRGLGDDIERITKFTGIKKAVDVVSNKLNKDFDKLWKVMSEKQYDTRFKSTLQNRQIEWWKEEGDYLDIEKS